MDRQIIHVDISTFAVSIERLRNSWLRKRPVIIGYQNMPRSLVYATSFEAREMGINRGMPLQTAHKMCRELIIVPPDYAIYSRAMHAILKIMTDFSPIIEPKGYGHAFLDMTGTTRLFGATKDAAAKIQRDIRDRLRLDSTLGVASNKLVSKIASAVIKPISLQDVAHGQEERFIGPLEVQHLPNINTKVKQQLMNFNIRVIQEIAQLSLSHLTAVFGKTGSRLYQASHGIDNTPVQPPHQSPNILEEQILSEDTNDIEILRGVLRTLVERGSLKLRRDQRMTRKFTLEIDYSDHRVAYGQHKLQAATNMDHLLFPVVDALFQKILTRRTRVRKLQLRFFQLVQASVQLPLFSTPIDAKTQRLSQAVDSIRKRFGGDIVQQAMSLCN